ncbi:MAG: methyltransferase [Pseudomonadota bacterium]
MSDRLRLAVENGHVVLPEGNVLVVEPRVDSDLSIFSREKTEFRTSRATIEARLRSSDLTNRGSLTEWVSAVLFLPRAKEAQRAVIRFAREAVGQAPIIVDGDKSDGIESIFRELKGRAEVTAPWSKAHGKVFTILSGTFDDWPEFGATKAEDGWWRAPGVFSADGIDPASLLLAENLPSDLNGHVVDLGAGWGFLAHHVANRGAVTHIDLVEDDALALSAASHNVKDLRATFHHADALTWSSDTPVDHVVTNPPFHTGRAADPALGQGFIRTAACILQRNGSLWLVANRQLPYESTLNDAFREVHLLKENAQFKVYRADRPRARRKG